MKNGEVVADFGSNIPTAVTFDTSDRSDSSAWPVLEYATPGDGSEYAKGIREIFPILLWGSAMDNSRVDKQAASCREAAEQYYAQLEQTLRQRCPEYFDLPTGKGLEVYVWQMGENSYSCGLMMGTNRSKTAEELLALTGVSIPEMRTILSAYGNDENDVAVIPIRNPLSDYYYEISDDYALQLRDMLLN